MKKSKVLKRANNLTKRLNRQLNRDVFGDRFYAHEVKRAHIEEIDFIQYELIDREHPERNKLLPWMDIFEITISKKVWVEMNDFITSSDFWRKYHEVNNR